MDGSNVRGEMAGPLPAVVQRALVDLLPYQRAAVTGDGRFTWSCWARQTGKSFLLAVASYGERTVVVDSGIDGRRTERGKFSLRRVLRGLAQQRNQIIPSACFGDGNC